MANTEDEQIEAIKSWWKDHGKATVAAVVVAVGGFWGWNAYQDAQVNKAREGSVLYEQFSAAVMTLDEGGDIGADSVRSKAQAVIDHDNNSLYADFAKLYLAKLAVESQQYDQAQENLQRVVTGGANRSVQDLARLRLARVMAAAGEADQALDLLQSVNAGTYGSAYAETRGDILVTLNRINEARTAYQSALQNMENPRSFRASLVQLKIDNTRVGSGALRPGDVDPSPQNPHSPNPHANVGGGA